MKLIPFNALGDKCKPKIEKEKKHKELNKNARKKLFSFLFRVNKTSIHHYLVMQWIIPYL